MIIPLVVAVLYYWMIFFLWMNMICCTLKHLWSSVFLRKTIQNGKKKTPHCLLLASCLRPPDIAHFCYGHYCHLGFFDHGFHKCGSVTWTWCLCRLTLLFMMTSSVPRQCMDYAHYRYSPCWFISAFITSISDCLLSQQDLVSNILTDVVDKSFSDSNWTTTALLHQWCPWCPAYSALVIWM